MSDELNQHDSSQPSITEGPNGAGKPSEPVSGGMTDSQATDYYNKTQQLAQERRAFEAEREAWNNQRGGYQQPQNNNQFSQQNFQQNQNQNQSQDQYFNNLVKEFGYDGALAMLQSVNQLNQPVQQQIEQAKQLIQQTQAMTLMSGLKAQGKETYGQEWNKHEKAVMDKIIQFGLPLDDAWKIVAGPSSIQAGIDQAYKAQEQKVAANVAGRSFAPAVNAQPVFNSVEEAFKAAWNEHGG